MALGELQAVQQDHAHYYQALAEATMAQWNSAAIETVVAQFRREHDNMRAALSWAQDNGDTLLGLRLANALWAFWRSYGYISEGRTWLEQFLVIEPETSDPLLLEARQNGLHAAAWLASDQHDFASADERLTESLGLRRTLGDADGDTDLLVNAARQARTDGDYQAAATFLEQVVTWHRSRAR